MSYSRNTLIINIIWKLLERFSLQIVSFIVSIVLARILLPEEYGVIAILLVFINIANVIVDGGLNTALIQKKNADNVDFSTIFYVSMMLALILYFILFFLAPIIANFYDNVKLVPLLRVLSLNLFFNSFNAIQRAYVSKYMLFRKLFYSSLGAVILSGICGIVMAYKGCGEWTLVGQQLISSVLTCLAMWYLVKWRPDRNFSFERFKGLFDYGSKIFMTNLVIAFYENIRGLIIGKIYSPASLAYFDRGKIFPTLVMDNICTSVKTILFPALSSEQEDKLKVKQMMKRSMKLNCFVTYPLLIGLFVTSDSLVSVLLTEKWLLAVPFIRIFCIAYLLMPIQLSNIEAIKALGFSGITLKLEIIKKIVEALILIVSFSIDVYAVAWGVVIYNLVCLLINLYPNVKLLNYKVSEQFLDIIPILLISLLMGFCIYWIALINIPNWIILLLQVLLGLVIYIVLCFIFRLDSFVYMINLIKDYKQTR